MANYNVGIDFGTSLTKICVNKMDNNGGYIFYKFPKTNSYLLPSTICLKEDGKCTYGEKDGNLISYFKMAALFDEEFSNDIQIAKIPKDNIVNYSQIGNNNINQDSLNEFPFICCIMYLCYCILDVKKEANNLVTNKEIENKKVKKEGSQWTVFLKEIFNKNKEKIIDENDSLSIQETKDEQNANNFIFTIGVPTEYKFERQIKRCRKQNIILFLAKKLADIFVNQNDYLNTTVSEIRKKIDSLFTEIIKTENDEILEKLFEAQGTFVIAETTAGIFPWINSLQLRLSGIMNETDENIRDNNYNIFRKEIRGNYCSMDIGAGTTDVSFFNILPCENGKFYLIYYSSKSLAIACNYLYKKYSKSYDTNTFQQYYEIDEILESEDWLIAIRETKNDLQKVITKPDNKSVFGIVREMGNIRNNWNTECDFTSSAKGCFVYGGGSRYEQFACGTILLDNGGVMNALADVDTNMILRKLVENNEIINSLKIIGFDGKVNENQKNELSQMIDLLIISLGLAMQTFDNRIDVFFNPEDIINDNVVVGEVPHPVNEGMYIPNIYEKR